MNIQPGSMIGYPLDSWNKWINIAYLVSLTITLVLSLALWRLSSATSDFKDRQLAQYKIDAGVDIAHANKEAAEALLSAASANERAAKIEAENLRLQKALEPRILGLRTQFDIAVAAKQFRNQRFSVLYPVSDAEALRLAQMIFTLLNNSTMQPVGPGPTASPLAMTGVTVAVNIRETSTQTLEAQKTIMGILKKDNPLLGVSIGFLGYVPAGVLTIIVCSKPPLQPDGNGN